MKAGIKTTEFWVTVLLVGSILIGWIGGKLEGDTALIASAVASGLYAASRGLAKGRLSDDALRRQVVAVLGAAAIGELRQDRAVRRGADEGARPG